MARTRSAVLISLFLLVGAKPVCAQAPGLISASDSVVVWTAALDTVAKSLNVERHQVLWLQPTPHPPSATVVRGVQSLFPNMRVNDSEAELFLCPPGRTLTMPGTGCPIRENGAILRLRTIKAATQDEVSVTVSFVRSNQEGDRTWLTAQEVLLARTVDGRWQVSGFGITIQS